jgi:hypothetical protein
MLERLEKQIGMSGAVAMAAAGYWHDAYRSADHRSFFGL